MTKAEVLWDYVQSKFKSGNDVEIERITLTKKELEIVTKYAESENEDHTQGTKT
jgi:hypothetical protein